MACPLEVPKLVEQRSMIRFLLSEGEKPAKIFSRMISQYGATCMNRGNFYKWVEQFKNGRTSVTDEERPGRPVEVSTPSLETRINDIIREDRRVTVEIIAKRVVVSVGTVHNIISNKLKYRKTSARWVPKELTQQHKETRLKVCTDLKERYEREGDPFLNKILTCDETWVHYFEPESKRQSMEVQQQRGGQGICGKVAQTTRQRLLCNWMDHRTFKMSAIRANDQVVACPYNPSHQILKSRLQTHLVKCARQHKEKEMATCAFNSTHRVPRPELAQHLQECPDRKTLEGHKFMLSDESCGWPPNEPSMAMAPPPEPSLPECEENWDDEVQDSTYDPSQYVSQMKVLRTLTGATKAERKKFRLEERRRVTQLEAAEAAAAAAHAQAPPHTGLSHTGPPQTLPDHRPGSVTPSATQEESPWTPVGVGQGALRRPRVVPDSIRQSLLSSRLGMGRGAPPAPGMH